MKELTKAEELVLVTILRMEKDAYGVSIKRNIKAQTGKDIPYGTLYFLLDQLNLKQYVSRTEGEPTPERGGRSKTYYLVTPKGREALKASLKMYRLIWDDLPHMSLEDES